MFLLIESGYEVQVCRRLSPTETLDIDITIQRTKKPGSPVVWNSAGYWFKPE